MTEETTVKDIMTREVPVVSENDPIARVRNLFMKKKVPRALVYDEEPKGIITEGDITRAFTEERRGIDEVRVREIMTRSLVKTETDKKPEEAARMIIEKKISSLPVIVEGEVKGILTKNNLAEYYSKNFRGIKKVKDLMTEDVKTIKENQSIFHAAKEMDEKNISRLVVTCDKRPIGIITEKDISFATRGQQPSTIKYESKDSDGVTHTSKQIYPIIVSDLMRGNLETTGKENDAAKAGDKMLKEKIGSLIVKEGEELEGIITKTDLVEHLSKEKG